MPNRYRLIDEDGNDLGPLPTRRADWRVGERVSRWHGEELEVSNVVEAEGHEGFSGYIVVRSREAGN
jgi:hypothetical protein